MKFALRLQLSSLFTSLLFLWIYSVLVTSTVVNGQWETPNNLCGGEFRAVNGTIDFVYNNVTNPDPSSKKVCIWTIIPFPFQGSIEITIDSSSLSCNANDRLGFTGFNENATTPTSPSSFCNVGGKTTIAGSVAVVTLISALPNAGTGFKLTWRSTGFYSRIRFVTLYNSYGKASIAPLPYFAAGFMGNSLSTFSFPMGNRTTGYTLRMEFWNIELLGHTQEEPKDQNCPGRQAQDCSVLMVCNVQDDGTLALNKAYRAENATEGVFTNANGLFLIMWGGNYYNARGGGRMVMSYSSVRA